MWLENGVFLEGEDIEALKSRFIEICAFHRIGFGGAFTQFDAAKEVFKTQKDPYPRCDQAATLWFNEIETKERIRVLIGRGQLGDVDASEDALISRVLRAADDPDANLKD